MQGFLILHGSVIYAEVIQIISCARWVVTLSLVLYSNFALNDGLFGSIMVAKWQEMVGGKILL